MKAKTPFVHLHNHTEYSFLDGAMTVSRLVARAAEYNMPALAITDHGGMFGVVEFHTACLAAGIKPIIGFEAYVAPRSRHERTKDADEHSADHLVLLARDMTGYRNLMKLSSAGYLEGFYYKPRIDLELLRAYHEGLIATTACIAGAVPRAIIAGDMARARALAEELAGIFGENNFYLEVQNHGIPEEARANAGLRELAASLGLPLVAAQDAHYLERSEAASHEILLCLQTHTTLNDPKRYRFSTDQVYFRSPDEMIELFKDCPEAIANTVRIAERCNVEVKSKPVFPSVEVPDGFAGENAYVRHLAREGLRRKYEQVTPELEQRLTYELDTICRMGYAGYFLIVYDFVQEARRLRVPVGCRGSVAGSLVAYALDITSVDPIKFGLLFERFLNPERVSLPDADIDFADKERHKIIEYVISKYGRESVCQIINFGRMKAKMVVKDVARAMGIPVAEANRLAAMVTEKTLEDSVNANGELSRAIRDNPQYQELFRHARVLEGLARQAGMHAGGVIIANGPVVNWAPLFVQQDSGDVMTQYDMNFVEKVGLVKMDFLGLSTLSVQQETLRLIRETHGVELDLWKLPDDDRTTYELFGRGETTGIFQFESQGMQDYLRKLKPTNLHDLIALNALYRPGPMQQIDVYIRRKHGQEKVEYLHPLLKDVLDVSYGVITYQEDVMRVVQVMAGFSLGQADLLRRAMSKKNVEQIEKARDDFVAGATGRGVEKSVAVAVFDLIRPFAQYGFNKSHATVYAHVAYQSGYLKAHYPLEYMTACMTTYVDDPDYFPKVKAEAERMGLRLLAPDVNRSAVFSCIEDGKIRLGLNAVANVGKAADAIVAARKAGGAFRSIFDLCARVDARVLNKTALESLVCAGALDSISGATRAQHFAAVEKALEYGSRLQKEQSLGQMSLFAVGRSDGGESSAVVPEPALPVVPAWQYSELLAREKEVLRFYVSGHPLDRYRDEIEGFATLVLGADVPERVKNGQRVTVGGMITAFRTHTDRRGKQMAFAELEDFEGAIDLVVFADPFEKLRHLLAPDAMVLVQGTIDRGDDPEGAPKLMVENAIALNEARERLTRSVHIRLNTQGLERDFVADVAETCKAHPGTCALVVHLLTRENNDFRILSRQYRVSAAKEALNDLRRKLGERNVWLSRMAAA